MVLHKIDFNPWCRVSTTVICVIFSMHRCLLLRLSSKQHCQKESIFICISLHIPKDIFKSSFGLMQVFYNPLFSYKATVYMLHGQWTSRESFFSKIRKFWAWADKLGWNFEGHFGYFQPNYWHYFGTVSPLFMGKCSWIFFLQKILFFKSKTYNSQILPK